MIPLAPIMKPTVYSTEYRYIFDVFFMHDPANTPVKKPQWYVTAVFGALAMAFIVTSFQYIPLNFLQPAVLSVGGHAVRLLEFRQAVARKMDLLRAHKYNPAHLKDFLIKEIAEEKALALEMEKLGIRVSKKYAREKLQEKFQDTRGKFDESLLKKYRERYGLTVPQMIREEQYRIGVERLRKALLQHVPEHTPIVSLAVKGFFQKRQGYYYAFSFSEEKVTASPSEKELKELFAQGALHAPEYRTYTFIHFSPETLAKEMTVSSQDIEDEVKKMGSHEKNPQEKAEKTLRLHKAVKKAEDLFVRIEEDIGAGDTLEKIAKHYNLPLYVTTTDARGRAPKGKKNEAFLMQIEDDHERNHVQKELVQKVFASNKDQDPEWIQTTSGNTIFSVVQDVTPEREYTYEEVRPLLEKKWRTEKQKNACITKAKHVAEEMSRQKAAYKDMNDTSGLNIGRKMPSEAFVPPLGLQDINQEKIIPLPVKKALFHLTEKSAVTVVDKKIVYVVFLDRIDNGGVSEKPGMGEGEVGEVAYLMQRELEGFFWSCYVESLKKKYPLSVEKSMVDGLFDGAGDVEQAEEAEQE